MQKHRTGAIAAAVFLQVFLTSAASQARADENGASYPAMAPLDQYFMQDEKSEIALARSAAPHSVSDDAEVMILGRRGYTIAANGSNGFVCLVQRSWAAATDFPEFWNPRIVAPICVNPAAARTYLPGLLLKAKLAVAGKTKPEIAQAIASALARRELLPPEPGAMSYMMSKQQYLSDRDKQWHPHLMWFVPGDPAMSWGANAPGSPVLAANDHEDGITIFLVWVDHWSDGTSAPRDAEHNHAAHAAQ